MKTRTITIKAEYEITLDEEDFKELQKVMRVRGRNDSQKVESVKRRLWVCFTGIGSDLLSDHVDEQYWIRDKFNEIICKVSDYTDDKSKPKKYWSDFLWDRFHLEPKVDVQIKETA